MSLEMTKVYGGLKATVCFLETLKAQVQSFVLRPPIVVTTLRCTSATVLSCENGPRRGFGTSPTTTSAGSSRPYERLANQAHLRSLACRLTLRSLPPLKRRCWSSICHFHARSFQKTQSHASTIVHDSCKLFCGPSVSRNYRMIRSLFEARMGGTEAGDFRVASDEVTRTTCS